MKAIRKCCVPNWSVVWECVRRCVIARTVHGSHSTRPVHDQYTTKSEQAFTESVFPISQHVIQHVIPNAWEGP